MNTIGYNVRELRILNGWTQEQLVAKCNLLEWSISRGTLAKIESKKRKVSDYEVLFFAKALNTEINNLYDLTLLISMQNP
ncbi:MAG: helix-turn-helix transcriptional regulator [Thalassotalea sp.]|nr:helix-turn-helix transcriptional regulator [Thalassotalea sp.]